MTGAGTLASALSDYRIDNISGTLASWSDVLVPFVAEHASTQDLPLVAGAGMGALTPPSQSCAVPNLFGGLLALSGSYDVRVLRPAMTSTSSGAEFLAGRHSRPAFLRCPCRTSTTPSSVAQGADETGIGSQARPRGPSCRQGHRGPTFEYWGFDVGHDPGPGWQEEARQILPCLLVTDGLLDRRPSPSGRHRHGGGRPCREVLRASQDELSAANAAIRAARAKAKSRPARVGTEEALVEKRARTSRQGLPRLPGSPGPSAARSPPCWRKRRRRLAPPRTRPMRLLAIGPPQSGSAGEARAAAARALTDRSAANGRVSASQGSCQGGYR